MTQTRETAKTWQERKDYIENNPNEYPNMNEWINWIDYYDDDTVNEYPNRWGEKPTFPTKIISIKIDDTEIPIENKEWKTAFKEIIKFYDSDIDFIKEFNSIKESNSNKKTKPNNYEQIEEYKFIKKDTTKKEANTRKYASLILPVLMNKKTDIYFKYYIPELENEQKKLKK